jgi:hypothetical protein
MNVSSYSRYVSPNAPFKLLAYTEWPIINKEQYDGEKVWTVCVVSGFLFCVMMCAF